MSAFLNFVLFAVLFYLFVNVNSLDICGAEHIQKCHSKDSPCIEKELEPKLRQWILSGRPEYFMENIDPYRVEEIKIPVNGKTYTLHGVKISGFGDAKFSGHSLDLDNGELKYAYTFKLYVKAASFLDDNRNNLIIDNKDFFVRIENLYVNSTLSLETHTRCDGNKYVMFKQFEETIRDVNDKDILLENPIKGRVSEDTIQALVASIGRTANFALYESWRMITHLPLTTFIIV